LTEAGISKAQQLGMLPMQKTDRVNKGGLHYPTLHLYKTMVIVEQIYCALLTDDNILAFGPVMLKRLHERISADGKICSLLACTLGKDGNGVDEVVNYALQTFAHVCGSDYASKLLFQMGKSYTTATRMDLQVKTESDKNKKATVGVISPAEYK
jgi:hypothetical protein